LDTLAIEAAASTVANVQVGEVCSCYLQHHDPLGPSPWVIAGWALSFAVSASPSAVCAVDSSLVMPGVTERTRSTLNGRGKGWNGMVGVQ